MESMEGLEFKSLLSDLADRTFLVPREITEQTSERIRKSMEEYELVFRKEQSEAERSAAETILNF